MSVVIGPLRRDSPQYINLVKRGGVNAPLNHNVTLYAIAASVPSPPEQPRDDDPLQRQTKREGNRERFPHFVHGLEQVGATAASHPPALLRAKVTNVAPSYVVIICPRQMFGMARSVGLSISCVLLLSAKKLLANQLVGDIHRTEFNFGCHKLETLFVPAGWPLSPRSIRCANHQTFRLGTEVQRFLRTAATPDLRAYYWSSSVTSGRACVSSSRSSRRCFDDAEGFRLFIQRAIALRNKRARNVLNFGWVFPTSPS